MKILEAIRRIPQIIRIVRAFLKKTHRIARLRFFILAKYFPAKRVILAQMVPMRRCNLDCSYCDEYDRNSDPVPLEEVKQWIDKLAELRTLNITISGGEPMMRGDDIFDIIRYIRSKGIMAGIITNGYYLDKEAIRKFNKAGLQDLQISIDNLDIDKDVSKKSLNYYERRNTLETLRAYAKFDVNINSVLGSKIKNPEDALTIAKRAVALGFDSSVGVIHDRDGLAMQALSDTHKVIYEEIKKMASPLSFASFSGFQDALVDGKEFDWKCRAGARYLYICEHGNVQWCSQHRCEKSTAIDIPLKDYSWEDFDREYKREKWCAPDCTIQCVRLVGLFDEDRDAQEQLPVYQKQGALPKEVVAKIVDSQ